MKKTTKSGVTKQIVINVFESFESLKQKNNPNNEPTGHFTGRCSKCGSNDLWDDNMHYGCNTCGAFLL